jgi:type VI secretion system secreted protein Hcp
MGDPDCRIAARRRKGFKGESNDSKHPLSIEVESFSFGATNHGSSSVGSGAGAGKVSFRDLRFRTQVSAASCQLMLALCSGKAFAKGQLFCRKQGGIQQDYFVVTIHLFIISSYECTGATGSNNLPIEEFTINFGGVQFEYRTQMDDGTLAAPITAGWDVKQNRRM